MNLKLKDKSEKIKKYFENNAGRLSILFFLGGFIIDNLTLTRIDSWIDNLILLSWLFLALTFILINNIGDYKGFRNKTLYRIYSFAPLIIQLSFGALFSGYVIFYSRASSFYDSWPFLVLLYFLFIGNEKFRKQYEKFYIQISILYFAILSFLIFYIPIIFKKMNDYIFILTGFISLFIIYFVIKYFFKIIPNLKKFRKKIIRNIVLILTIMNIFYFNHLLPPVPLSVKKVEVLHYADRNEDGLYELAREKRSWYDFSEWFNNIIHWKKGERIYVYAAVFAPTDFQTKIKYAWYWYDDAKKDWVFKGSYKQKIVGGRSNGFRSGAYMQKVVKEGDWKLELLSNEGTVIDSLKFRVVEVDNNIPLEVEVLE